MIRFTKLLSANYEVKTQIATENKNGMKKYIPTKNYQFTEREELI